MVAYTRSVVASVLVTFDSFSLFETRVSAVSTAIDPSQYCGFEAIGLTELWRSIHSPIGGNADGTLESDRPGSHGQLGCLGRSTREGSPEVSWPGTSPGEAILASPVPAIQTSVGQSWNR